MVLSPPPLLSLSFFFSPSHRALGLHAGEEGNVAGEHLVGVISLLKVVFFFPLPPVWIEKGKEPFAAPPSSM